ncbi:hypothetical protein [Roseateles asaccharophilus]|uniref:Uncharacterized protein n=1 Tax=Roseateles asaccharophilus TaxID=582607 RepID=A0ABU2AAN3_9BURK|nr:hypothetical protein [Roseateles asaccharophilus]MDR7334266.1 hypothetical protein [Roseateles asaccharophilus]
MPQLFPVAGALLTACIALSATAQPRPDPADARAKVPPVAIKKAPSPQAAEDPPPADWRAANERVERVGGWRTYARETPPQEKSQ